MSDEKHVLNESDFADKGFAVRWGRQLFKARNSISAPIFLFLAVMFWREYENDMVIWTVGPAVILAGEALRIWAMRHIGRSARTRKDKARRLVTTGPYVYTRNPLYIGNHIILVGYCVLSELLWAVPIALCISFVFYSFIVAYEEELLKQRFGEDFVKFMEETPRWLPVPRIGRIFDGGWREALYRERSTIYGIVIGVAAFGLKELVFDLLAHM
jgi:protein-S-isoprenylcysteine O-methyltransferase Ste14